MLVDPKGEDYSRYRGASLLTPNKSELRQVVGKWRDDADLAERAQKLRKELALDALLVTRSEEGMTVCFAKKAPCMKARVRKRCSTSRVLATP